MWADVLWPHKLLGLGTGLTKTGVISRRVGWRERGSRGRRRGLGDYDDEGPWLDTEGSDNIGGVT